MNVLLVINRLGMGGAERFVVQLSEELTRRGHRAVVVSDQGSLTVALHPAVTWIRAAAADKSPRGILALATRLRGVISHHSIEVVHANSPTTALAARLAGARCVIASAHGVWRDPVKRGVSLLFSLGADCVVGCSDSLLADLLRHGLAPRKARTIHNGVPCPVVIPDPAGRLAVRAELGIAPEAPVVLAAARLARQKGLAYLIKAMPAIFARLPDAVLLIAGEGPLREALEAQAREAGGDIRLLGRRDDVNRILAASDVFCLPSLSEGLPLAVAEAMAAGLPVVATPVGGLPEIVVDGETGWLVPPRDPRALAAHLLALLESAALRARMGAEGRRRAQRHFSLDRMTTRFEALYERQASASRR